MELIRGSGNVFRDFGMPNAEEEQRKALLVSKIIALNDAQICPVQLCTDTLFSLSEEELIKIVDKYHGM
jgi:hypothetical protein